jgi:hypothetical protein
MTTTYYLRNTNSDLTGGADFSYKLLTAVAGEATSSISIAKGATEESYGFVEPAIPNNADWDTGAFVVKVKVTAENSAVYGSIRVDRVSAAGALVESSTTTAEQQFSSIAVYTFNVTSKDWTAGTTGDRIRVAYIFRNTGNKSFTMSFNTSDSSVVTSVQRVGGTTKSLAYKIAKPTLVLPKTITSYTAAGTTAYVPPAGVTSVRYLVVAGGGQGGAPVEGGGGGGGAGGVLTGTQAVTPGDSYTVIVGAGGTYHHGANSKFDTFEATGGGQGRTVSGGSSADGGSGGGACNGDSTPGTGTAGQGYDGGAWSGTNTSGGSGGGGAGAAGVARVGAGNGTNGGVGVSSDITGSLVWYGGGGGGGAGTGDVSGNGGTGGGGKGATSSVNGVAGSANTGGGGGGAAYYGPAGHAAAGGSGIVIIRSDGTFQLQYVILPLKPTIIPPLQYCIRSTRPAIQKDLEYRIVYLIPPLQYCILTLAHNLPTKPLEYRIVRGIQKFLAYIIKGHPLTQKPLMYRIRQRPLLPLTYTIGKVTLSSTVSGTGLPQNVMFNATYYINGVLANSGYTPITAYAYQWTFPTYTITTPSSGCVYQANTLGLMAATVMVLPGPGSVVGPTASTTATVIEKLVPDTPDFYGTPRYGASPLTVDFTSFSAPTDGVPLTYDWNYGAGWITETSPTSHVFVAAGLYTVSHHVHGTGGESSTIVKTDYINVGLTPPPVTLVADFEVAYGGTIYLVATYGCYLVTLTITDRYGGTDSVSKYVKPDLSIQYIAYTDLSTPSYEIVGWVWDFGDLIVEM